MGPMFPPASRKPHLRLLAFVLPAFMALVAAHATDAVVHEEGLPLIHNFSASAYAGAAQNWSVTQGADGVIYVGNVEDGVLAYDGTRWQRIAVPDELVTRSLATAPDGRVYVGTVGNFGYLRHDKLGRAEFVSLLDKVPADARDFSDVWRIHVATSGVYFFTTTHVFRLADDAIHVIRPKESFHLGFVVNGTVYVRELNHGLMRIVDDTLEPVPGGERFAEERIYAMLPWRGPDARRDDILIGTRTQGWMLYRDGVFEPWPTPVGAALEKAAIYDATWLADGRLAIATLHDGLFLLDREGRMLRHLTRATGLDTDVVLALYEDREHGLWLATGNGVTRVDTDSPLSHFGPQTSLHGAVLDIVRHQGTLYVGTTEGLYRLTTSAGGDSQFERLPDAPGQNWSFVSIDDTLLVAGNDGVFSVAPDGSARQVLDAREPQRAWSAQPMLRSSRQPDRLFVGYKDGVGTLRQIDGAWTDEGRIASAALQADTLLEDARGRLWMGLYGGGVAMLPLPDAWRGPSDPATPALARFGTDHGLPDGKQVVVAIDGEPRFLTSIGIFLFDETERRFRADPAFEGLFPEGTRRVVTLRQDSDGDLWIYTTSSRGGIKEVGRAFRAEGHWQWSVTPLQPLAGHAISALYDDAGTIWLGGDNGLFRYGPTRQPTHDGSFRALIRQVSTHDGAILVTSSLGNAPVVPYQQNALRFEFSAPSYGGIDANEFQTMLEGVDRSWSPWNRDAYRDYTNLSEGRYRFRVRARNIYDHGSLEAAYDFRVLPPWYRTWWAWLLWIGTAAGTLFALFRWRSRALERRNRALAELVAQQTTELASANQALQASNLALAEQSVTDPLTGLKNRRYLHDHIEKDLAVSRRQHRDHINGRDPSGNSVLLFLMVDIDHFKGINDTYGHAAGDAVLQQLRTILLATCRDADIPIRWGGEEFLIVGRFARADAGPAVAERIRAAVAAHRFDLGDGQYVNRTCSIGYACYPPFEDALDLIGWEQVVNMADECMYAAKRASRNAWVGVPTMARAPTGDVMEALRQSLDALPAEGPIGIVASWLPPRPENAPHVADPTAGS